MLFQLRLLFLVAPSRRAVVAPTSRVPTWFSPTEGMLHTNPLRQWTSNSQANRRIPTWSGKLSSPFAWCSILTNLTRPIGLVDQVIAATGTSPGSGLTTVNINFNSADPWASPFWPYPYLHVGNLWINIILVFNSGTFSAKNVVILHLPVTHSRLGAVSPWPPTTCVCSLILLCSHAREEMTRSGTFRLLKVGISRHWCSNLSMGVQRVDTIWIYISINLSLDVRFTIVAFR